MGKGENVLLVMKLFIHVSNSGSPMIPWIDHEEIVDTKMETVYKAN